MNWGVYENRIAVLALFRCGKRAKDIFSTLKPLGISERFVFRTIARFKQTGETVDRVRSGRPRCVRTKEVVNAVRARIRRNPLHKQTILSRDMNISPRTMSRILKDDLHVGAYKRYTRHLLTAKLKEIRQVRSQALLTTYGESQFHDILFTDEKIFPVEESFHKQNDRVLQGSKRENSICATRTSRGQFPGRKHQRCIFAKLE
mgnify:CR=1 FL=1